MQNGVLNRALYYSQSDIQKIYKLSPERIKTIIADNNVSVLKRPVEIGYDKGDNFKVEALYILKEDWHKIKV